MRDGRRLAWAALGLILTVPGIPAQADDRAISLFNGKDLSGWYTFIPHKDDPNADPRTDPKGVFKVEDGVIHVSGQEFAAYFGSVDSHAVDQPFSKRGISTDRVTQYHAHAPETSSRIRRGSSQKLNGGGMKQRDAPNLIHGLRAVRQQAVKRQVRLVRCSDCNVDGALLNGDEALLGVADVG